MSKKWKRNVSHPKEDEDDQDIFNSKNKSYCRACIDVGEVVGASMDNLLNYKNKKTECPLDKAQLGRSTWSFLHTLAAYYPEKPSETEMNKMNNLISSVAEFYPCPHCAEDFNKEIVKSPPRLTSRFDLSQWFCEQHNVVNVKLGKSKFNCSNIDERWRYGPPDGSCDPKS